MLKFAKNIINVNQLGIKTKEMITMPDEIFQEFTTESGSYILPELVSNSTAKNPDNIAVIGSYQSYNKTPYIKTTTLSYDTMMVGWSDVSTGLKFENFKVNLKSLTINFGEPKFKTMRLYMQEEIGKNMLLKQSFNNINISDSFITFLLNEEIKNLNISGFFITLANWEGSENWEEWDTPEVSYGNISLELQKVV